MTEYPVEEIPVRETGPYSRRLREETGTEAVAFVPGSTRPFAFSHEWIIDPDTFARYFATNRTHAQLKKFLILKRIPWILLCHRKTFNSYRQSFLFSIEPRDADPTQLRTHKASIKIRALQSNGEGPPPPNSESSTSSSTFAEVDLANFAVASFVIKFVLEGEVVLDLGEDVDEFRDDVTQLMDQPTCQIVLRSGEEITVHKGVLTRQSAVFLAMLREDGMKESREARVEIPDISPPVVRALIHWLYTARIPTPLQNEEDASMLAELFRAADKYQVSPLGSEVEALLVENLCNDSVCTVFALADTYQAPLLKTRALTFLLDNFAEVRQLSYFERLVTQHPHLSLEILRNVSHK